MSLRKLLLTGSLVGLIISTQTLAAGRCEQDIKLCDAAYQAKKEELKLADLALSKTKSALDTVARENQELKDERDAWYRNPWVLLGLGVIVGVGVSK